MNERGTGFASLFEYYGFTKSDEKKYPVITGILRELTPERIDQQIGIVVAVQLPPQIHRLAAEYDRFVGGRPSFTWKWTCLIMDGITLDSVDPELRESVSLSKIASGAFLNVLVDDIADKRKDGQMLERVSSIICSLPEHAGRAVWGSGEGENELGLIARIWGSLNDTIRSFPRYKEFEEVFLYDYRQFLNAASYACLVNRNLHMMNLPEYQSYLSPSMQAMILGDIDLMASPGFDTNELGMTREVFWKAQRMARIGNSISTFEREFAENDITSEVFPYLVSLNYVKTDDLRIESTSRVLDRAHTTQAVIGLLAEWENYHKEIEEFEGRIKSFSVRRFLRGLEGLIAGHLISIGNK
jgi:hypothetical protein